jgi:hypothetical protein
MTQKPEDTELELQAFFDAEKSRDAQPSDALMAAILRDAQELQPAPAGIPIAAPEPWSFKRDIWQAMGGWGAATALSACLLVGVTLGYTPPDSLSGLTATVLENTGILVADDDYATLDDMMAEG